MLRYEDLEGGATTQAHIHVGQELVNGGIAAWLCDSAANPVPAPVDVPACTEGQIEGTITAADVRIVEAQGLRANETPEDRFDDLVRAIRFGLTYANVHTQNSPSS